MAKSKIIEAEYKAEKLRRTKIRKQARKDLKKYNKRYSQKECDSCGGYMTWCTICETWSQYCCEEYGICMCS